MKITRTEKIVMIVTGGMLLAVLCFFAGRLSSPGAVIVAAAEPDPTYTISQLETAAPLEEKSDAADISNYDSNSADASESGSVNLNTADQDALETLDGIGEVLAQRIIDYRNENGVFTAVEELTNVEGIGEKIYEKIKNNIYVE